MIDFHTHPVMIQELFDETPELEPAVRNIFGLLFPPQPLQVLLAEMEAAGVDQAVLLPVDCTTTHGCKIVTNQQVAALAERHDRFIGFASVDPHNEKAPRDVEYAIKTLGLRGLKLDPAIQQFYPEDRKYYPIYQACVEQNIPLMIHCGLSWSLLGKEKFAQPLPLESIVQDFPELKLVIPHFGWPWFNEAIMLAMKYRNVYLDTSIVYSGTPLEVLQHVIGEQIGISLLERNLHFQVLYGSNYPRADMRRSVRGIQALDMSRSLREHLCEKNARVILGMEGEGK